jgi:hypothetical protein
MSIRTPRSQPVIFRRRRFNRSVRTVVDWRRIARYNASDHWTIYLLATASNLFLAVPLYIAARAGVLALLPLEGSTSQFISAYGINWGITLDFLWTMSIFQGILAVLVVTVAGMTLAEKSWRVLYAFSSIILSGFVGYWLGVRFLQTLGWVSVLQNSGIDSAGVFSDLFWFGLGATIFYVAMILVLRRSYNKLTELKSTNISQL